MKKDRKNSWPYMLDLFFTGFICCSAIALVYVYVATEFDTFVEMGENQPKELSKACPRHEVTRVKIGAIAYALPTDKIWYGEINNPKSPQCLNGTSLPSISLLLPFSYQRAEKIVVAYVMMSLSHMQAPHKFEDTYARYIKNGRTEKLVLVKNLPMEEGFYIADLSKYHGFFIVADPEIRTPMGNPIAFRCDFRDGVVSNYNCHTTIALSPERGLGIAEIKGTEIPRRKLIDLYRYALAEEAKLVINDADTKQ